MIFCIGYVSQILPKVALYPAFTRGFATAIVPCFNYDKEHTTVYHAPLRSQEDGLIDTVNARDLLPGVMKMLKAWDLRYGAMR